MKNIKWQYFFMGMLTMALAFILVPNILAFFGVRISFTEPSIGEKVSVLEQYINQYYWDRFDNAKMEDNTLKAMVQSLDDKYSAYFTEEEYQKVSNDLDGIYNGIGIVVRMDEKTNEVLVQEVYEGSPAQKAGLLKGDIFVKVNGKEALKMTFTEISNELKGEAGSSVTIVVDRGGKEVICEAVRDEIKVKTVEYKILEEGLGYINISSFDHETTAQFQAAMKVMNQENIKGVIFDLRYNGGGTLNTAIEMLDEILPKGMILSVKSKDETLEEYKSTDEVTFDKPCVVMINGSTASAAEVFAGVLQDRGTASVVGTKSFGKGIIQTIFDINDTYGGGAIKLTTAEYFLPSGRSIHEKGLTPDVYAVLEKDKEDSQLQAAVKELSS